MASKKNTMESPVMDYQAELSKGSANLEISVGSRSATAEESAERGYAAYEHMRLPDLKNTESMQVVFPDNDSRGYESDSNQGLSSLAKPMTDQKSDAYSYQSDGDVTPDYDGSGFGGHRIETAMVVMLGIGYYDNLNNGQYKHLDGVPTDYRNMIKLFVNHLNYSFLYETDDGKLSFLTKADLIKQSGKYPTNFKIKWSSDEIINFVQSSKISIKEKRSDSLIFIVSSECDATNTCIIDSEGKKLSLSDVYSEFTGAKDGLPYLNNKPKIFFVDTPHSAPEPQNAANAAAAVKNKDSDEKESKQEQQDNGDKGRYGALAGFKDFCFVFCNVGAKGGKDGGYLCNALPTALKKDPMKMLQDKDARELKRLVAATADETLKLAKESGDDKVKNTAEAVTYRNNVSFNVTFG